PAVVLPLSLHDALPVSGAVAPGNAGSLGGPARTLESGLAGASADAVSRHTLTGAHDGCLCGSGYLAQRRGSQSPVEPVVLSTTGCPGQAHAAPGSCGHWPAGGDQPLGDGRSAAGGMA